jgi:hypothetical protein
MIAALLAALLCADPPARQPIPPDWVGWALTDLVQQPEADRPFLRYLAIPPWGDEKWVPLINFALNSSVSQASTIQRADVIANGWMMRIDLRRFSPRKTTIAKTLATWDSLAKLDCTDGAAGSSGAARATHAIGRCRISGGLVAGKIARYARRRGVLRIPATAGRGKKR